MDKYLKAIADAEKRIRIYHEASVKACEETNSKYTSRDAHRVCSRAWTLLEGIRMVATYDSNVTMNDYDKIVKGCDDVLNLYEREYDFILREEFRSEL